MGSIAATLDPDQVLEQTRREAKQLFGAKATLLPPGRPLAERRRVPAADPGRGDRRAAARARAPARPRGAGARALLADFASRTVENARLLAEAQVREAERARLSDQLITAEQEERRRLALFLHDGPVQSLAGISLMLDAVTESLAGAPARRGRAGARARRSRGTATRSARCATSPSTSSRSSCGTRGSARRCGVRGAGRALERDPGRRRRRAAEALTENAQVGLYQIIRDAVNQAIRRGPPTRISISVVDAEDGSVERSIADDGAGERRRATFDEIEERARTLSGQLLVDAGPDGGTDVRVDLPPYVGARRIARVEDGQPQSRTHLLFVWTTNGYELRERDGDPPGLGDVVEEGEAACASRRSRPHRCRATRAAARTSAAHLGRALGRHETEHERLRETARVAAARDPPTSTPAAKRPSAPTTRAARRPQAALRVGDRGRDVEAQLAVRPRRSCRPLAEATTRGSSRISAGTQNHAVAARPAAIAWARSLSCHAGGPAKNSSPARRRPALAVPELREADVVALADSRGRRRHVAAVELVQVTGGPGAARERERRDRHPRSRGSRGRRSLCSRAKRAGNPPVASTSGGSRLGGSGRSAARRRPRARAPPSGSRGSKRLPVVRGLGVSSQTTSGPSETEPLERLVEAVEDEPLEALVAAGHSRRKSSNVRWRQTTQLESSIEPAGPVALLEHDRLGAELARPRGGARGRPSRRRRRAARSARSFGLCSTYSTLTRSGPQTKTATCWARRRSPRPRGRAPSRPEVLVGGLDLDREMVQQRPFRVTRLALVELDERAADLHARHPRRPGRSSSKPSCAYSSAVSCGGSTQRDVVEVVLDLVGASTRPSRAPRARRNSPRRRAAVDPQVVAEHALRLLQARDPQRDVLQRARLPRALGGEQRQLAPARVRPTSVNGRSGR